jgi:hypothetical protein
MRAAVLGRTLRHSRRGAPGFSSAGTRGRRQVHQVGHALRDTLAANSTWVIAPSLRYIRKEVNSNSCNSVVGSRLDGLPREGDVAVSSSKATLALGQNNSNRRPFVRLVRLVRLHGSFLICFMIQILTIFSPTQSPPLRSTHHAATSGFGALLVTPFTRIFKLRYLNHVFCSRKDRPCYPRRAVRLLPRRQ